MHDFGNFVMILEKFLLFTEIPTEKMLQRQIYVQNIQYDVLLRKRRVRSQQQVLRHFDDGVGDAVFLLLLSILSSVAFILVLRDHGGLQMVTQGHCPRRQ